MSKTLVAYFSVQGTTKRVAKQLAEHLGADLFEIIPLHPYTDADIRYTNPLARCNKEKLGKKDVPIAGKVENFAPNIVNTFCKEYEWSGKRVYAFATSGGSGIGKTAEKLKPYLRGAVSVAADLVTSAESLYDR